MQNRCKYKQVKRSANKWGERAAQQIAMAEQLDDSRKPMSLAKNSPGVVSRSCRGPRNSRIAGEEPTWDASRCRGCSAPSCPRCVESAQSCSSCPPAMSAQ